MKSSNQLQRDAELRRQELSSSLDGLRTVATPSYVTTEVLNLAKDSSLSIAKALAEQARANPIPALLIGAGLVMMLTRTANVANGGTRGPDMFDKAGTALKSAANAGLNAVRGTADAALGTAGNLQQTAARSAHQAGDLASDAVRRAGDVVSDTARHANDLVSETANRAGDLASEAARRASVAASGLSQTASSTARHTLSGVGELGAAALENARHTADQVRDSVADTASGLLQQGRQTAQQLADQAQQFSGTTRNYISGIAEEQPIVVAALGAAIGAAIGAALPMTAAERQYLGSTSARVKQAGRDTISKVADVVKSDKVADDLGATVNKVTGRIVGAVTEELGEAKPSQAPVS